MVKEPMSIKIKILIQDGGNSVKRKDKEHMFMLIQE